jgi:hypothetical protein
LFLVTPANGIEDLNFSLGAKFPKVKAVPGLNATVAWHKFDSDVGSVKYGTEWDAQMGFKVRKTDVLFKFADYNAKGFGVDKRVIWIQLGWAY